MARGDVLTRCNTCHRVRAYYLTSIGYDLLRGAGAHGGGGRIAARGRDRLTGRDRTRIRGLAEAAIQPDGLAGGRRLEFGSLGIGGVNDGLDFGSEAADAFGLT
jgi:hypothetical protein